MIAREPEASASSDPVMDEARATLSDVFGFDDFRDGQAEVVEAVLQGRDVLCVMPTGAGKSLCYQLPAIVRGDLTLVISPLIALMEDQVASLRARDVPVAAIHSGIPRDTQSDIVDQMERDELRLLYVAPERFRSRAFRERVARANIGLVAVDEAHCISQWGHDFRPDYRRIGGAIEWLRRPQVLALTATATPDVQDDVVAQLALRDPARFIRGIVRDNLTYEVVHTRAKSAKDDAVLDRIGVEGTLVYAATRKHVEHLHKLAKSLGHASLRYHAGLSDDERARAQHAFLENGAPLMFATNAFGMGVDRPDIRQVIHYDMPKSVEAYVQESGRAGRDGDDAHCVLCFNAADIHIQRFFIENAHPSPAIIEGVFAILAAEGDHRIELTTAEIAERLPMKASAQAVGAALGILDDAELVRRRKRGEGRAKVTVQPSPGDLFSFDPLPPGLSRLLAALIERFGVDREGALDIDGFAEHRGVTTNTVRRGLNKLHALGRIVYVPPFQGRATELRGGAASDDALAHVDFARAEERRQHDERKLDEMVSYAHAPGCRVVHLLRCFGAEAGPSCGRCDRCARSANDKVRNPVDDDRVAKILGVVLDAVRRHDGRFGFRKLAQHLAGSKAAALVKGPLGRGPTYGALSHLGAAGAERYLRDALDGGLLRLVPKTLHGSGRRVHLIALSPQGLRVHKGEPLPPAMRA